MDAAESTQEELKTFCRPQIIQSSDDERDSNNPIMDTLYDVSSASSIIKMSKFPRTSSERPSSVSKRENPKHEMLKGGKIVVQSGGRFIFSTTVKHGGQWEFLGQTF